MRLIRSLIFFIPGLASAAYGISQMPQMDLRDLLSLDKHVRKQGGAMILVFFGGFAAAMFFLSWFNLQMHASRNVDPEVKKYIDSMYEE